MVATQPTAGIPAIFSYPSYGTDPGQIFGPALPPTSFKNRIMKLAARDIQRPNSPSGVVQNLLDTQQAALGKPGFSLIDQHGHFVFYSIHINPQFLGFLKHNNQGLDLTNSDVLHKIQHGSLPETDSFRKLELPNGIAEYKASWAVDDDDSFDKNYFVIHAQLPHYILDNGKIVQSKDADGNFIFDTKKVALIALHVVFTLPGHPEMIWSTFEHVSPDPAHAGQFLRDNAPEAHSNPFDPAFDASKPISDKDYLLYKANTIASDANLPITDSMKLGIHWDEASQSFTKGGLLQTSVYRPYPGSKALENDEDDLITKINDNATRMFDDAKAQGSLPPDDRRQFYRLVGATWIDEPSVAFTQNVPFVDPKGVTTEPDAQGNAATVLAGEGRLGSTAIESFTESESGAPNCFSCHDTQAVKESGLLLPAAKLNVTHILSKFLFEHKQP